MNKVAVNEAVPIINRLCANLLTCVDNRTGNPAFVARTAIGELLAQAPQFCWYNSIGQALNTCFGLVRLAGCTIGQMEGVRRELAAEATVSLGATLIRDFGIQMALAQEAKIIVAMTFSSREDVDALLASIQQPFADAEEIAADSYDPMVYRGLVELHAAIVNYLVQTARPLPTMLTYQFAAPLPSLVISHRLYGDASRYDEVRDENKIVHPAFCPVIGRALSA
jgi:prophage DNA circulation protein